MMTRTETIQITNGSGVLEVRGSGYACGLFVRGKPFMLNWNDNQGSIGQDVLRDASVTPKAMAQFCTMTTDGVDTDKTLEQQLAPLLQQFRSGTYTLLLEALRGEVGNVDWYSASRARFNYYPYETTLMWTQPAELLNEDRVLEYMYLIEAGVRPVIVTTGVLEGMCEFILDGHHKLCAYGQLRLPPHRLCITTLNSPRLTVADYPKPDLPRSYFNALTWEARQQ